MKYSIYFLLFLLCALCSCDRIKNKGKKIAHKSEIIVKSKIKDVIDKIFPIFDSYQPDTKYNKKRFKDFLEIELQPDVKELYCYGDFFGADYKVLFSFTCDTATIQRIIEKKNLKQFSDNMNEGLHFGEDFHWWNKNKILEIKPFKSGIENEFWQFLWYDKENKKAYYQEFSL